MPSIAATRNPGKLLTRDYILVCLASGIVFASYYFMLPTLPLYGKSIGAQDFEVGLLMAAFTFSSIGCRFVVGRVVDSSGRKWILVAGTAIFAVGMIGLAVTTTVLPLFFVRLVQGLGFGTMTTATGAMVADLAPPKRRGEAVGYYGVFNTMAMAVAPSVALSILGAENLPLRGFTLVYVTAAAVAVASLLLSLFVREPVRAPSVSPVKPFSIGDLFLPSAILPAIALMLIAATYGCLVTFLPLYAGQQNSHNVAVFFLIYALVVMFSRPLVGVVSDRLGPRRVLVPAMALSAVSVSLVAISPDLTTLAVAAVAYGLSFGGIFPSLMSYGLDIVPPERRGAAMATFMSGYDGGIALGATVTGVVAQFVGYRATFPAAAAIGLVGLLYFLLYPRFLRHNKC